MKNILFAITFTLLIVNACAQEEALEKGLNSITKDALQAQMEFLASDWTEGREVGTEGAYLAADYIASIFRLYGLQPGGDHEWTDLTYEQRRQGKRSEKYQTYFQNFKMVKKEGSDNNKMLALKQTASGAEIIEYFNHETDYNLYDVKGSGFRIEAPIVFVGYGYVNEDEKYDDYKGVDVDGKVILRMLGYPGFDDTSSVAYKKFTPEEGQRSFWYSMRQAKDNAAIENGAVAVIDVPYGDVPDRWVKNLPFRYKESWYEGDKEPENMYNYYLDIAGDTLAKDLTGISVSKRFYVRLVEGEKIDIEEYKKRAAEKLKPGAVELDKELIVSTRFNTEIIQGRNVLGVIEGKKKDEIIVVGAHYDHLGKYNGYIWNGADDNASGTVAVMTIARAFAVSGIQPEKTIVFACWTGEEKGLLGSRYFVNHPYGDTLEHIKLNMNYDMVSRDSYGDSLGIKAFMSYSEETPRLKELSVQHIEEYDLDLEFRFRASKGGGGGSDHAPFSKKGIPFYFIITGMHEDYHQPSDEISKVNYDKMLAVVKLGYLNLWKMANEEIISSL